MSWNRCLLGGRSNIGESFTHFLFQIFGRARSPNQEFRDRTKRDAQNSLNAELDRLIDVSKDRLDETRASLYRAEFDEFKRLFGKFLEVDAQESIEWGKIGSRLPSSAVSNQAVFVSTQYGRGHLGEVFGQ